MDCQDNINCPEFAGPQRLIVQKREGEGGGCFYRRNNEICVSLPPPRPARNVASPNRILFIRRGFRNWVIVVDQFFRQGNQSVYMYTKWPRVSLELLV